jgi:hypothetical protein
VPAGNSSKPGQKRDTGANIYEKAEVETYSQDLVEIAYGHKGLG